jgi:single-stranded DNA-specific DHH superfamily exonuclease
MDYLLGNENDFWDYLNSITKKDKIAILTHNDLDGIASAIFLEEILNKKNIKISLIKFLEYKKDLFGVLIPILKEKKITRVLITDINADSLDRFDELYEEFEVFLIDHHPINPKVKLQKNILKTENFDCASLTVFNLGKNIIEYEKNISLICATLISDMSFKKETNMGFIKENYPDANEKNIFESIPGMLARKISSSLIYYSDDLKKVYDLIKEKNFLELEKADEIITREIQKYVEKFEQNSECYPEKKLCFYYFKPKYNIASVACTIVSQKEPKKTLIFLTPSLTDPKIMKISARNQSGEIDLNILLKKATSDLHNAMGGGHSKASGGTIMKTDLEKFKKNILENM